MFIKLDEKRSSLEVESVDPEKLLDLFVAGKSMLEARVILHVPMIKIRYWYHLFHDIGNYCDFVVNNVENMDELIEVIYKNYSNHPRDLIKRIVEERVKAATDEGTFKAYKKAVKEYIEG